MNDSTKKLLEDAKVNVNEAMGRFMDDDDIYIMFLKKFSEDECYDKLLKAIEDQDIEEAFNEAHTLKGVVANLSLSGITEIIVPLVEILRKRTFEGTQDYINNLKEAYKVTVDAINSL